jgi:CDP-glucose 4,6-dehydratase
MEGVGLRMFGGCYAGRRVLVTGHTGFKGSWLALWLTALGAQVSGLALPPLTQPNHWDLLGLPVPDLRADMRNAPQVSEAIAEQQPEIVFHLAAQSLVRASYAQPLDTWSTNVMGTAHLLDACRHHGGVRAIIVVTSDKCYENRETTVGYRETDPLGGHDPYSASKAACELLAASYRRSFFHEPGSPLLATVRAGNVIGGGDWSTDRLIPDVVRAVQTGAALLVRSPEAVRPWQYVLESLSGYLLLGQRLLDRQAQAAGAWNFGPTSEDVCTVGAVLQKLKEHWPRFAWEVDGDAHPHETRLLQLDSSKARELLGWRPVFALDQALAATAQWYRAFLADGDLASREDLQRYTAAAEKAGLPWVLG